MVERYLPRVGDSRERYLPRVGGSRFVWRGSCRAPGPGPTCRPGASTPLRHSRFRPARTQHSSLQARAFLSLVNIGRCGLNQRKQRRTITIISEKIIKASLYFYIKNGAFLEVNERNIKKKSAMRITSTKNMLIQIKEFYLCIFL
jgi:hypothetical protein